MAITISTQITGQEATSTFTYCYLYEPLKIVVSESDLASTELKMDLLVISTETGAVESAELEYGLFDINPGNGVVIDIMDLVRQYHDSNIYKISNLSELVGSKDIPISKYKYQFDFYTENSPTKIPVKKLPILGGRDYENFTPTVQSSQELTEAEVYGITLSGRWNGYPNISTSLSSATSTNSNPTITSSIETGGKKNCGGMLIWKSRFGGWMYWGMEIMTQNRQGSMKGKLSVGMFDATDGGNPYVPVDYTHIDSSYTYSLKALSLNSDELEAVYGIVDSPAVYYMKTINSKMELMRVSTASAPISTLTNGGDFSVSLKSISKTTQRAR